MIPQIFIMIFGVTAIWLVGSKQSKWKRWGFVCGICAQPFWMWTSISHEQWGIAAMSLLYGASWIRGLKNNWSVQDVQI